MNWLIYEEAARKVLADIRDQLKIASIDGKQKLEGASGTNWEVDAKAWLEGSDGFLVVEVRRHTTSGLTQEQVAAVAYRIRDVGAQGGITVSPLPLQKGASIVATREGIAHVRLDPHSTTDSYLAEFMGKVFHGASIVESLSATDSCDVTITRVSENDT